MKKFAVIALAAVLSMTMLTGCGNSKKAAEATTEVKEETVDYSKGLNADGTLEGVKASDYVTVCDYSSLKIAKKDIESCCNTDAESLTSWHNSSKIGKTRFAAITVWAFFIFSITAGKM